MTALFTAFDVGIKYPMRGFCKGTVEYISRVTGKQYIVEPSPEGFLVHSDGLLFYTGSNDRADAMRFIELSDAT